MPVLLTAALPVSLVIGIGFLILRGQRAHSADYRRTTLICMVLISLCFCVLALVPARWLPVLPSTPTPITTTLPAALPPPPVAALTPVPLTGGGQDVHLPPPPIQITEPDGLPLHVIVFGGTICVGVWWLGGLIGALCLRMKSKPAPGSIRSRSIYPVRLSALAVPACLGGLRPVILLPASATEWDTEKLSAVLCHEEAHLAHRDHLWIGLALSLCMVQWFNPLAWLVLSRLRLEAERAADDTVLAQNISPSNYAVVLLQFQSSFNRPRRGFVIPFVAQPLLRKSGLATRLEAVLSKKTRRSSMTRKQFVVTLTLACAFGAGAATLGFARRSQRTVVYQRIAVPTAAPQKAQADTPPAPTRKIELVQVGVKDEGKPAVIWDANGDLLRPDQVIKHGWRPNEHSKAGYVSRYRHIVFRVQAEAGDTEPETSVGSPSSHPSLQPQFTVFGYASSDYLMTKNGWHYFVDHFSVGPTAQGRMHFDKSGAAVTGEDGAPLLTDLVKPSVSDYGIYNLPHTNLGVALTLGKYVERGSVTADPAETKYHAELAATLPKGFNLETRAAVWSKVTFTIPDEGFVKFVVTTVDGNKLPPNLVEGSFGGSVGARAPEVAHMNGIYYIGTSPENIADIRYYNRASREMDLTDVPLSPRPHR